jgi:hypothetical protein
MQSKTGISGRIHMLSKNQTQNIVHSQSATHSKSTAHIPGKIHCPNKKQIQSMIHSQNTTYNQSMAHNQNMCQTFRVFS